MQTLKGEAAQKWVRDYILRFYNQRGYLPSRSKINRRDGELKVKVSSGTIDKIIREFRKTGYQERRDEVPREEPESNDRDVSVSPIGGLNIPTHHAVETDSSLQGWQTVIPQISGLTVEASMPDPEKVWAKAVFEQEKHEAEQRFRQNQVITFPPQPICLVCIGDRHIGAPGTDYKALRRDSELIAHTPGMYAIDTGDGVDNFIKAKHQDARAADPLRIDEQWILLQETLRWLGDRFLISVSGNHNHWSYKIAGWDIFRSLLPQNVLYDPDEVAVTIQVGTAQWRWIIRHKTRVNSIYNALHGHKQHIRLGMQDADVIVAAHIHRGAVYEVFYHQSQRKIGILTGTYKIFDSHVREEGFLGGGLGTTVAVVMHPEGWMQPFDNLKAAATFMETLYFQTRLRKN